MSTITVVSDAKCKDCTWLKNGFKTKKDGSLSKRRIYCCSKGRILIKGKFTKACDQFEIVF